MLFEVGKALLLLLFGSFSLLLAVSCPFCCHSRSHPIRLRRRGAWVAHLWFRRACVCFCYCGAFFEVKRYGSTFGGGFAGILVVSVIDYGVCVSQSESFVIDRHHRNFSWSSSYSSFCIGEYGYEISANEVRAVGPCQSG